MRAKFGVVNYDMLIDKECNYLFITFSKMLIIIVWY